MSTLHTNSAAGAITRLRDMGLESFLIGSSLLGVIAQRLVRRLCTHCRTTSPLDDNEKALFSFMGGRSWNWRKQRVKTANNGWANTIRVYAEGDESQPVIALQIIPPGESK